MRPETPCGPRKQPCGESMVAHQEIYCQQGVCFTLFSLCLWLVKYENMVSKESGVVALCMTVVNKYLNFEGRIKSVECVAGQKCKLLISRKTDVHFVENHS